MANPGNTYTQSQRRAREEARVEYLRTHKAFPALPGVRDDVSPKQSELLTLLVTDMQMLGLYSESSDPSNCRWGIRNLVTQIRGTQK